MSHPQTGHSQRQQFSTCRDSFVVMSPSWSGWDPWAASIFLGQEKEREANGVETRSKLGCHRERGPPRCVTPSPGEGVVGNELLVGRRAGEMRCSAERGTRLSPMTASTSTNLWQVCWQGQELSRGGSVGGVRCSGKGCERLREGHPELDGAFWVPGFARGGAGLQTGGGWAAGAQGWFGLSQLSVSVG